MRYDVAIIGAGASGLMCGCYLAYLKKCNRIPDAARIVLLERNQKPGRKLLMTGSGRCNITNVSARDTDYYSDSPEYVKAILDLYSPADHISFLENVLGVRTVDNEDLVYPATYRSATVLDAMRLYLSDNDIDILTDTKAVSVRSDPSGYVILTDNDEHKNIESAYLVNATGGMSYPVTGSDGSGYGLTGISRDDVISPVPALVPLKLADRDLRTLSGTSVSAGIIVTTDKGSRTEEGTLLFTDYGISGICVMILSGDISSYARANGRYPRVSIDLLCSFNREETHSQIDMRLKSFPDRKVIDALSGLIRDNIIGVILKRASITTDTPARNITERQAEKIAGLLKEFPVTVTGDTGYDNSQVTRGGIRLGMLGPELLDGNGIYYCGEIINVDGPCGGYNLQWAWSSAVAVASDIGSRL